MQSLQSVPIKSAGRSGQTVVGFIAALIGGGDSPLALHPRTGIYRAHRP